MICNWALDILDVLWEISEMFPEVLFPKLTQAECTMATLDKWEYMELFKSNVF